MTAKREDYTNVDYIRFFYLLVSLLYADYSGRGQFPCCTSFSPQRMKNGNAPHVFRTDPHVFGTASHVFGTEPHVFGAEPNVFGTALYIFGTEPHVLGTEPQVFSLVSDNNFLHCSEISTFNTIFHTCQHKKK